MMNVKTIATAILGSVLLVTVVNAESTNTLIKTHTLTYTLDQKSAYHTVVFEGKPSDENSYLTFYSNLRDDTSEKRQACDERLPITLAELQRRTGNHIVIYSGFRTKEKNETIDGAPLSHHLNCSAVDFRLGNLPAKQTAVMVVAVMDDLWGDHFGGVGVNKTTVHVDAGARRFWQWNQ